MDRSSFIRKGLIGFSAGAVAPNLILAACTNNPQTKSVNAASSSNLNDDPKAGGIYYTELAAGRWSEKAGGHTPKINAQKISDNEMKLEVVTSHPMDGYAHYIIKHQLLDSDFNFIEEELFDPEQGQEPKSEFTLQNYSGTIYALSYCNLHDVWLSSIDV
ncbi:MAG: hypothetical protein F6K19_20790 [Cyanothece sp. SIO1E1]|nr:hypothetical protein [Cyanothece sp. SIO1E1]